MTAWIIVTADAKVKKSVNQSSSVFGDFTFPRPCWAMLYLKLGVLSSLTTTFPSDMITLLSIRAKLKLEEVLYGRRPYEWDTVSCHFATPRLTVMEQKKMYSIIKHESQDRTFTNTKIRLRYQRMLIVHR